MSVRRVEDGEAAHAQGGFTLRDGTTIVGPAMPHGRAHAHDGGLAVGRRVNGADKSSYAAHGKKFRKLRSVTSGVKRLNGGITPKITEC
jgi:hypothetical protein